MTYTTKHDEEKKPLEEIVIYDDNDKPLFNLWHFEGDTFITLIKLNGEKINLVDGILPSDNTLYIK